MQKRSYKKILLGVLGLLAIVSVIAAGPQLLKLWREKNAVERVFSDYSSALVSGKFEDAYSLCGADFRGVTSLDVFAAQQKDLVSRFGNLKTVKQEGIEVTVNGSPARWTAVVNAGFQYESKTIGFEYSFSYDGVRWTLSGYKQL
jgi:hypothetical protein